MIALLCMTALSYEFSLSTATAQSQQAAASVVTFDIPPQPLSQALVRFSKAASLQLFFDANVTRGVNSPGVQGALSRTEALTRLLAGSGLIYRFNNANTVSIQRPSSAEVGAVPAGSISLDAIDIKGESALGPVDGYVATRSMTATKTDTPIAEIPQSVSVIGRHEMEARGVQDVMDAIQYSPGVGIRPYGPDNRGWEDITIRGFGTYNSTYRDGLAQTPSGVTYYLTETYGLERVEVLRGPSSMMFGQGDAGGIINRVSKRANGERIREVELQYGSFDRKQIAFDIGDRFVDNKDLSFRFVGVGLDSNDQDKYPNGQKLNRDRLYLAPSLKWQPTDSTTITFLGEYLKNRSDEDPYYINASYSIPTPVKMGDPGFNGIKQDQMAIGYQFEHLMNDNWAIRQNFRASHLDLARQVVWYDSVQPDGHTYSRIARTWNDPMSQAVVDTQLQGQLQTGWIKHTLLFGVDWSGQEARARRYIDPAPDIDTLNPVYNIPIPLPQTAMADFSQTNTQLGFYLQDQIALGDHWIVTLGGRQDIVKSATDDRLNAASTEQKDNAFSGRAGLSYKFNNGFVPYVSYTESFLPTSGLDSNNNPFKPSEGKQVEAGIKFQPAGSRSLFSAAVFDLNKTNVVTYDPRTFEGRQIGKQRTRGIELEAKTELMGGLNATVAYTWLDMKVVQSADPAEVGKVPPIAPIQTASVWLDYEIGGGLRVAGGLRYIGERWNDPVNSSSEPGVTVADAAVHYQTGDWRFALNVSNLFNKKYYGICYFGECYRANERTATLTAKYRF